MLDCGVVGGMVGWRDCSLWRDFLWRGVVRAWLGGSNYWLVECM